MGLVAALLFPAALSTAIYMPTDDHSGMSIADDLTLDYYNETCPGVRDMVRTAVEEALEQDHTLAAGLLRVFFHDCFPQVIYVTRLFIPAN
jgi:peroxidase